MNQEINAKDSLELLLMNHQHIHENIKFADQKASAIIAANGALLALSYSLIQPSVKFTLFMGFFVCLVLAISIAIAFLVIKPRSHIKKQENFSIFDPKCIARYKLEDYQNRMNEISTKDLLVELRKFIYDRACIDNQKYIFLRLSLFVSAIGWGLSIFFATSVKIFF
jgi:hypothetical protein